MIRLGWEDWIIEDGTKAFKRAGFIQQQNDDDEVAKPIPTKKIKLSEIPSNIDDIWFTTEPETVFAGTTIHFFFKGEQSCVSRERDLFLLNQIENDIYPNGLNYVKPQSLEAFRRVGIKFIQQDDDEVTKRITLRPGSQPWFDISDDDLKTKAILCECGAEKAGTGHATWCPKWKEW